MTRDELLELIAAAEKATKGPWEAGSVRYDDKTGSYALVKPQGSELVVIGLTGEIGDKHDAQTQADTDHIANCDPDTIIELARLALAAMDAEVNLCPFCESKKPMTAGTFHLTLREGPTVDLACFNCADCGASPVLRDQIVSNEVKILRAQLAAANAKLAALQPQTKPL